MFVASAKSGKKIFHKENCSCAKRIFPENVLWFKTEDLARAAGYTMCSCCSRMRKHYREEKKEIAEYCEGKGLKSFFSDGMLYVISLNDVAWRMVPVRGSDSAFFLQHESLLGNNYQRSTTPYRERNYHLQRVHSNTVMGYLEYLYEHDRWVRSKEQAAAEAHKNKPRYTKKDRKRKKRAQRAREIRRVSLLLNSLGPDYSVPWSLRGPDPLSEAGPQRGKNESL